MFISHTVTSLDQLIKLFETTTKLRASIIIPDKDIPLIYWTYYGKLETGCTIKLFETTAELMVAVIPNKVIPLDYWKPPRKLEPEYVYYGWGSYEDGQVVIQSPGEVRRSMFQSRIYYGCASPVEQIIITPDLFGKAGFYVKI